MQKNDVFKLLVLGAIWGSSFVFMRILSPVLGPFPTACLRVLIAGSVLFLYLKAAKINLNWRENARHFLVIGFLNASLPFICFTFASLHAPAGLLVIMNSTTPLFGVLFSIIWLAEKLTPQKIVGFFLGTAGVSLIALRGNFAMDSLWGIAALAGLIGASCYGLASIYIKKFANNIAPVTMAGMSQLMGGLILLPFALVAWFLFPVTATAFTPKIIFSLLALSLLCSAFAFVLFYRLVESVGPTRTLTVGYLVPVFGILWGSLFLHETVTKEMIFGCLLILLGVGIITRNPTFQFFKRRSVLVHDY